MPMLDAGNGEAHTRPPDLRRSMLNATKKLLHRRSQTALGGDRKENEFHGNEPAHGLLRNGFAPSAGASPSGQSDSSPRDSLHDDRSSKSEGASGAVGLPKSLLKKERQQFMKLLAAQQVKHAPHGCKLYPSR